MLTHTAVRLSDHEPANRLKSSSATRMIRHSAIIFAPISS